MSDVTPSSRSPPLGEVFLVVGGAELLRALPCDEHLVVRRIGLDRRREPDPLLLCEVLGPGAEDRLDPVERVALPTAMSEGVLLDAAAHLVDRLRAEFHDVERVEHRGGVLELVVDRGLVAREQIKGCDLHVAPEAVAAAFESGRIRLPRPAGYQIQQPRPRLSVLVAAEIDHPGQLLRAALAGVDVMPDVLIDAERGDPIKPGLIGRQRDELGLDSAPHRLPRRPQLPGESLDGGVFAPQLSDRPADGSVGDRPAPGDQARQLLRERLPLAFLLTASPDPLSPHDSHPHRAGHVMKHPAATPATDSYDPARRTPVGIAGLETVTTSSPSRRSTCST